MKKLICTLIACSVLTFIPSCTSVKHDNGKHKGWYKNPKNPHNPAHVSKGKSNKANAAKGTSVKTKPKEKK